MNYIGSKKKLSDFIKKSVTGTVGTDLSSKVFCDLFAGTGIVGRLFKTDVKKVIANDLEYFSYVLNRNYIGNHQAIDNKESYLHDLSRLEPVSGFIFNNYCLGSGSTRSYFSDDNGQKIDAMRQQIGKWKDSDDVPDNLYFYLLATLLESADKVANTASVYGAYLKKIKKTAEVDMSLLPADFSLTERGHDVYNKDSNKLISEIEGDILYLDPPYNHRQYGNNYHLLNTIAKYDNFIPKGKTGQRKYISSLYCREKKVFEIFEDLIKNAHFKYIFLSYNNEGLMPLDDIKKIMSKYGKYDLFTTDYKRFKADSDKNREHKATRTLEYLHVLEKQ